MTSDLCQDWFDKDVVLDSAAPITYIGRLIEANDQFYTLADVDVHDMRNSAVTKEVYTMEVARNGVQPNRKLVKVRCGEVISLSLLEDIILY